MFRLARDLGLTLGQVKAMPSAEFVEWMAFYQVEHEIATDTLPPIEIDDANQHSAAIDALF